MGRLIHTFGKKEAPPKLERGRFGLSPAKITRPI
jgi:hypothetical protein